MPLIKERAKLSIFWERKCSQEVVWVLFSGGVASGKFTLELGWYLLAVVHQAGDTLRALAEELFPAAAEWIMLRAE